MKGDEIIPNEIDSIDISNEYISSQESVIIDYR